MRRACFFLVLLCLTMSPMPALGQTPPQPRPSPPVRRPVARKPPIGFRAYGFYDFEKLAASQTFQAVTGSSAFHSFGGGVDVTNVVSKVFVRVTFAHGSKDGERVFVNNNQVFPLGIPLQVGMTPIEIGGGWRTTVDRRGLTAVYAGASLLVMNYSETTPSGTSDDDTSKTFSGYTVFGGVDRTFHKYLVAGVEAQYRGLPNAIGTDGVSALYNETNLGGFAVRMLFGIRR